MKKLKKNKKIILGFLLLIIFLVGKNIYQKYQEANPNWKYKKIQIENKELKKTISVDGEVVADYELNLASEIPGIISKVYIKEGDYVKKGQLLIKLKDSDYRNQVSSAYVNQKINEVAYEKTKKPNQNLDLDIKSIDDGKKTILENIQKVSSDIKSQINLLETDLSQWLRLEIDDYFDHTEFDDGIYNPTFTYRIKSQIEISRLEEERKELSSKYENYKKSNKNIDDTLDVLRDFEKMFSDLYSNSQDFLGFNEKELEQKEKHLSVLRNIVIQKRNNLISLKTTLSNLKNNLDNNKTSKEKIKNIVNPIDLKLANERIRAARVQTHSAYTQLQKTYIRATKSGVVANIYKKEGEYAGPSQALIKIYSKNKYFTADIPEVDLGKIKKEMDVNIKLDAFKNKILKGKIDFIYPEKKEVFGINYYEAKIIFDKRVLKENNIFTGMSGEVIIPYEIKKVEFSLNRDIVKKDSDKYFVWILNPEKKGSFDDKFIKKYFEVGFIGDNFIEIKDDLNKFDILNISKK